MREILFKAKRADNDEWIIGSHFYNELIDRHYIRTHLCQALIKERTIGQYIGLKDMNGKKIFEYDIVKLFLIDGEEIGVIKWHDAKCRFMFYSDGCYSFDDTCIFEIIGNTYDNPELLNEVKLYRNA
jgi:uncharacterized phage protein (TIGR01671 family)